MSGTPSAPIEPTVLAVHFGERRVELDLLVPPDLLYCHGHFPNRAILPGVVQVHWAIVFARRHLSLRPFRSTTLQVKFRRLIQPGDRLTLDLRYAPDRNQLSFDYRDGSEARSMGHVEFEA
jgi:3-hydroxymyristoyl/3-hydroxydecanoyl-(acyl carrier protein) dehydratase